MKTSTALWIVVIIIVVLGGWYLWSTSGPSSSPAPAGTGTTAQTGAAALGTNSTATLGTFLTAQNGKALYTFDRDSVGTSTCYGACAQLWPPYAPPAGAQLSPPAGASGQVATITRTGGSQQVTYNGKPLYFYANDTTPGQPTGDGVGGVWHVAKP